MPPAPPAPPEPAFVRHRRRPLHADETECARAVEALRSAEKERFAATTNERVNADPVCKGLPLAPEDASAAEQQTAYFQLNRLNNFAPQKVVKISSGKSGMVWHQACNHADCVKVAIKPKLFCIQHGGGCKAHGRAPGCRECDRIEVVLSRANRCSNCGNQIDSARQENKGGPGICAACETHSAKQAKDRGAAP